MSRAFLALAFLTACHGDTGEDTYDSDKYGPGQFSCTPVHDVSMTFTGTVVDGDGGAPLAGVAVSLHDDKAGAADPLATATSAADGSFSLTSDKLTAWDGCLASAPNDYQIHAQLDERFAKADVNHAFGLAWTRDETTVTLSAPLALP